ncbi:hypothetical protein Ancab_012877 [Ancistrocladus abbreviatus]
MARKRTPWLLAVILMMVISISLAADAQPEAADGKEEHPGRLLEDKNSDQVEQGSTIDNHHEISSQDFNNYVPVPGKGK